MPQKMPDLGVMMNMSSMTEGFIALQLNHVSVCLCKKSRSQTLPQERFYALSRTGVFNDGSRHLSCVSINGH